MDFQDLIQSCRSIKTAYSRPFQGLPTSVQFSSDGRQVFFLASGSLYSDKLPQPSLDSGVKEGDVIDSSEMMVDPPVAMTTPTVAEPGCTSWTKLCSSNPTRQLSRSEQLLRERMRATGSGISCYDYLSHDDLLLVHGPQCIVLNRQTEVGVAEFPSFPGALDYKLCPLTPQLLGCVSGGEVWVLDSVTGLKHRMTSISEESKGQRSAGAPSFIIQEEFDRYTGYWWQPRTKDGDSVYRILFEEVDESCVEVVHTFNPSNQTVEDYKYPRPGSTNAPSKLRLLQFTLDENRKVCKKVLSLPVCVRERFPDCCEYLVRAGWSHDGKWVWLQLVDRAQRQLKMILIDWKTFSVEENQSPGEAPPLVATPTCIEPLVIWEETHSVWINTADILTFVPCTTDGSVQFIISSERSGFRHLYLVTVVTAIPSQQDGVAIATSDIKQLTSGDWKVFGSKIWLDAERQLVYFEACPNNPLEQHLCVVSYHGIDGPCATPTILTTPGCRHTVDNIDTTNGLFAVTSSSADCAPSVRVYAINHTPLSATLLHTLKEGVALPPDHTPPTPFQVPSATREVLHGVVYPPAGLEEGRTYPTILYVYGGPQIQMVTSGLSRQLPRIQIWCNHGYAVVMLDNRGSANRGITFAAHLKDRMGHLEVDDQVTGLLAAASTVEYIDTKRVTITGWSYGGYLSLMALALRPDVFKIAISGAPVTDWMYYDTGYTERYLGNPTINHAPYDNSSVLSVANKFPTEPHRLLIIHGLGDENVLFTHTSLLCDRLVSLGRPYQLQLYTAERHGLRSLSATLHCEATVLAFLRQHL